MLTIVKEELFSGPDRPESGWAQLLSDDAISGESLHDFVPQFTHLCTGVLTHPHLPRCVCGEFNGII